MKPDFLRPVVALDMDGVVRIPRPEAGGVEVISHEITVRRDAYPRLFHSLPHWERDGTNTETDYFSAYAVRWIRSLLDRGVDVRWATTWGPYANTYFTEPLGLPHLPGTPGVPTIPYDTSASWKARSIGADTRGRPVIWVDDHPREETLRQHHTPRALTSTHRINPVTGITQTDADAVDAWLALASTAAGQEDLRRAWRRELARRRRQPPDDPPIPYYAFV
ncbi:hypothetical protein [Microbacterium sp. zg.Y1084]|uniref:hypothetical protein n=1 Tax=Microbacterium sp. zg.Y1084 TaxID=2969667 RepID=UPI00214BBB16|nr:hypothetical protein [Microbacterium sp. zg.Y1084]MCR2813033.1 hypothetical protein [Microbacterium sp. zg.Y1084]